jgi:response regulator NasT
LRILVVDDDPGRTAELSQILAAAGHDIVGVLKTTDDLRQGIAQHNPDVVVVDMESPYRDYLDALMQIGQEGIRPIAMFVGDEDPSLVTRAIDSGVLVYSVEGLSPRLVQSVLQVAVAQFERTAKLNTELAESKRALQERKTVDRAKGLLMSHRGLSEDEAYKALRTMAMSQNRRLGEVAAALLAVADVIKR